MRAKILPVEGGGYTWQLQAANGSPAAVSPTVYPNRANAKRAVLRLAAQFNTVIVVR